MKNQSAMHRNSAKNSAAFAGAVLGSIGILTGVLLMLAGQQDTLGTAFAGLGAVLLANCVAVLFGTDEAPAGTQRLAMAPAKTPRDDNELTAVRSWSGNYTA